MKQFRNTHLMVSESGEVKHKTHGTTLKPGPKGYQITPMFSISLEDIMKELYPDKVTHGKDVSVVTVCNNGKFRKATENPKYVGCFRFEDTNYPSTRVASIMTGLSPKTVYNRAMKGIKGWSFIPKEKGS